MKWRSALSQRASLDDAVGECASTLGEGLVEGESDLVVAFVSAEHSASYEQLPELVRTHLGGPLLIGCSGAGVIGSGREVEHGPGLAMTAAHLPGVELVPFHVDSDALPDADASPGRWECLVHTSAEEDPQFILLMEPSGMRGEELLMGLDFAFPAGVKIGGLASGAPQAVGNALFLGDRVYRSGAAGVAMHGNIALDTIVSQGCRPIGSPMRVTACHDSMVHELDGRSPLEALKELYESLNEHDQQLARSSMFLGILMDELNESPHLGDFLIRNVVGLDPERGWLAVREILHEGQTVQFHLRDADTSAKDLDAMLTRYATRAPMCDGAGGLFFQCLGRGSCLYGGPDHDTNMFRQKVGSMPLTGFFCNGEIGPVGDTTFLHGYTSSFGVFRIKDVG